MIMSLVYNCLLVYTNYDTYIYIFFNIYNYA